MNAAIGILVTVGVLTYGVAQISAGYIGVDEYMGTWWAVGTIVLALLFRFTLPLTIGAFYGAWVVWGWHWLLAALFAAPGLAFVIPGVISGIASWVSSLRKPSP